ncbi:conserved hypothetical protein [delta proteobacterium NaphS2]|nr:conserved hypothetical protein [delta proteobacterium NaphS2]
MNFDLGRRFVAWGMTYFLLGYSPFFGLRVSHDGQKIQ